MERTLTVLPPASLTSMFGVQIDGQAMTFPADMPYEAWAEMDRQFEKAEMGLGWWRGDWYNHGEDHYEEFAQVLEVRPAKKRTMQNNGSVCKRYTPEQRKQTGNLLSFSHHAAVAYVDEPVRSRLLSLAIRNEWSVSKLREVLQEMTEHGEEEEAADDQGTGRQVNEEYLPVQLPLTVKSVGKLIEDHLDAQDFETLRNWLTEQIGDEESAALPAPVEDVEPWNLHAARMIREAVEEAEAYCSVPDHLIAAASKVHNWIESQDSAENEEQD